MHFHAGTQQDNILAPRQPMGKNDFENIYNLNELTKLPAYEGLEIIDNLLKVLYDFTAKLSTKLELSPSLSDLKVDSSAFTKLKLSNLNNNSYANYFIANQAQAISTQYSQDRNAQASNVLSQ